ncbi:hypothetical protein LBUCD034_1546 [Lentilactobacillus buchneri subsp. silagei CD034]|uniref:Uncharacterized protein n=1 Tax=Lentilactobacillus buchneri subsp. silagei CD034 TaxID=1071400 RepID=J9W237_LENBU|nr:hypothetical protein LBUCD034_1546 [Lentilactobacillus buchneri subsp. silagei CD034]
MHRSTFPQTNQPETHSTTGAPKIKKLTFNIPPKLQTSVPASSLGFYVPEKTWLESPAFASFCYN